MRPKIKKEVKWKGSRAPKSPSYQMDNLGKAADTPAEEEQTLGI